ncbi:serine/threonine protein kinase [Actinomadura rubrobrunea]|uniref:non-specific serine/threonine protein kinase n=1 Tax=Actinomadura rubrobrunea TaxID=115335 RepID=A0A9W6PU81_9ACTN|nr:Stk1 family PASTA domain-containing Ser/Thr kinase [Actinomadura rubrobrunea]GLW63053.1 serine/threonine protein kinase [Actinomadura rubrobrunea]
MDTTVADPLVGQVLDGRYRIESRVARGGMATVYVARDMRLDRVVAIKVMHANLAADEEFVARFIGEAKAAAALSHPNVVAVFDQRTDGEHVFLVMEYVPGRTLRDLLTERGRLGPRAALEIMQPVLAALGAAHRAGLVHRDVKPENVLITEDGQVKVADFGLARAETAGKMTKTGMIIGTVGYLAPEQVLSGDADVRTDVYAAGVMLYELLTGEQPHQGDTPLAVAYKHVNEAVPPPSNAVPGLPRELDALVARATAREPAQRPQDAGQFLALAAEVHGGLPPDIDRRVEQAAYGRTAVLESPMPHAAPGGGRTAVLPAAETGPAPVPPHDGAPRRGMGAAGRYVLIAIGTVAAVVLAWSIWYQTSGQYDHVPDRIIGMRLADARQMLADAGLQVRVAPAEYSDRVDKGEIAATDPAPGARVAKGETVTLTPSKGRVPREVPDVRGRPLEEAKRMLRDKGFQPGRESSTPSQSVPKGSVVRTVPAAGQRQSPDEPVQLVVSSGMSMPNVVGQNADEAADRLRSMGLEVKIDRRRDDGRPGNTVLEQRPAPGTGVSAGDEVRLVVNRRKCLFGGFFCDDDRNRGDRLPVPPVIGQSFDDAKRALRSSGFRVKIGSRLGDRVVGQNPLPGTTAERGREVTIWG